MLLLKYTASLVPQSTVQIEETHSMLWRDMQGVFCDCYGKTRISSAHLRLHQWPDYHIRQERSSLLYRVNSDWTPKSPPS